MRALFVSLALAVAPVPAAAQAVNVDKAGVAVDGYDPVAYFTDGRAEPGSPAITSTHNGATYQFVSASNRDRFVADPAKYLPAYGGYCAYGVANGYKVKVEADAFTIVDGTLYLNYDKAVMKKWRADIPAYIAKANGQWPALEHAPRK